MTVKELIALLQTCDQDRIVVISRDSEGNGYSELYCVESAMFCDGEIGLEDLTAELEKLGYGEEDVMEEGKRAVVLYP